MRCSACEGENRDTARFCATCGARLAARCAACGVELPPAAQFCDECGTPTAASTEKPSPVTAQSRKDVTIVFADLAGSTTLAERMDPESVRAVMDRYYAAIRRVVEERRGRVVKFIGDGVMAVFGVPETSEDDARRALAAALAMHAAFAEWVAEDVADRGVAMSLRVGVNTGEVIVSAGDDDVVGDAVNVASRLEHAAEHGTVLVGEATWRLARGYASFGAVQTLTVAGKVDPVRAYGLVSIDDVAADAGPEFVGRSHELDQLRVAFDDVVAAGAARLVTVLGSPGVGKTRLAAEFRQVVDEHATVLVARCAPEAAATLAPVAELLRAAARVTDTSSAAAVMQSLGALVPDDEPDRERIVASAAAILGAAPSGTPEETLWAVRRLLEVAARARPVVVMIDDLHWAEPMLLDLVDHLAEWTRAPVMLLVVARPELRDVRGSMVDGVRHVVVALEGLDGESTARLACDLLATDALPPGLLERLPASTGGNPLFLRELLRMLVDDDVLRSEAGTWQLSVAPEAIDVPPTIQSLLAARLDRLPASEQALLEHASIAGKEFPVGALHELAPSGQPTGAIDALLESLRRKELVEPDGTYWIDEPVYRFHHVLIRDAAYRRVLRQTRADLHEHLARWLEHKLGDLVAENGELVGHHLEQAYAQRRELGGLDAHGRDVGREAATHLSAAADRALDREDLPAAAALAARALRCLPFDDPARSDVLLVRCDALLAMGEATAGADAVAELARCSSASARLAAWCTCFTAQLTSMTDPSQLRESEQRVAAVASELEQLGDTRGAAKAHTVHATTLARLGRFADVETALDLALTRAREAGDRRFATAALAAAPTAQVWGPNPVPRAGGRCLDVVRLLRITVGSPAVEATSQRCQGVLEAFRGRAGPARRLVAAARGTLEELGLAHGLLETDLFAGVVELVSGDLDAARRHLRVAHDGMRALGLDADAARAAALLARASFDAGDFGEAADFAAEAKRLAGDDLQSGIAWRGVQAEIDARAGRHEEALALAQEAVAIAAGTDALVHHADACLALAAVKRAAGDERGAAQAARDATELYEWKGASALAAGARALVDGDASPRRAPATARSREPANECTEVFRRWADLFAARAWEELRAHVEDDFVVNDPRPVVGMGEQDRTAAAQTIRVQQSLGVQHFAITVVATRGDRLGLLVVSPESEVEGELFGTPSLLLAETTADARLGAAKVFDLNDVELAIDELNERYLEGDGAAYAGVMRAVIASYRAYNARDWDAFGSFYAPAAVRVDHRSAGWGTLVGVEDQVENVRAMIGMVPGLRMTMSAIHDVSEHKVVYSITGSGEETTGGDVELVFHVLERRDDDHRITLMEIFSEDMLDAAMSAFRGESSALSLRNACTDAGRRMIELFAQRDWTGLGALFAPGYYSRDRRRGLAHEGEDPVESLRIASELGTHSGEYTAIATRGERLALGRFGFTGAGAGSEPFTSEMLGVQEVDAEGRFVWALNFDAGDIDAAFAELDARYLEGEAAPFADLYRTFMSSTSLRNACDWVGMRALFAHDLVAVDHRPGRFGSLDDAAQYVDLIRGFVDLVPDSRTQVTVVHALAAHGCLARGRLSGRSADGGAVEDEYLGIAIIRDGHIARVEQFPAHALDEALRRFDELGPTPAPALDNLCLRRSRRTGELMERGDWEAVAALYADDILFDDRRVGMRTVATGRESMLANVRAVDDSGTFESVSTPIAIRGERCALFRHQFVSSVYVVDHLVLNDLDEHGLLQAAVVFDLDDLDGAFAELDARYIAGEAAPHADVYRTCARMADLHNTRDWDGMLALWSDDLVVVDHRPGSFGALSDRLAYLRLVQTLLDLAPDAVVRRLVIHRLDAHGCVVLVRNAGSSVDGGAFEIVFLFVLIVGDGHIARVEQFPAHALDEALSRFDELGPTPAPVLDNLCLRVLRRNNELSATDDWEEQFRQFADDAVLDDRRAGLRSVTTGRETMLTNARAVRATGRFEHVDTPLAVRGQRCALFHRRFASPAYEVDMSIVNEVDDRGVVQAMVIFDAADLDGAFAELDARYLAGEAAPYADAYRPIVAFSERYNRRDWDAAGALLHDDFVAVDHRAAGWGTVEGPHPFVELIRGLVDLAPDTAGYHAVIHELDAHGAVGDLRGSGTSAEDSAFELLFLMTIIVRAGRIARMEFFPPNALEEARARFDALGPAAPLLDNLCVRNQRQLNELSALEDRDGLASIVALDFELVDRRAGMHSTTPGRDSYLLNIPAMQELGFSDYVVESLAIRGERLALFRQLYTGDDFETGGLTVNEVDDQGVCRAIVVFDFDDLDGAVAELDARYLAGEGAPFASVIRMHVAAAAAFNRRDWDALRALDAPNKEIVDHRVGQFGMYDGRDDFIADIPAMIELTPDLRTMTVAIYPDHHGAVVLVHNTATTADGGQIDNTMIGVSVIQNGVSARDEYFPENALDAARARLAELAPDHRVAVPTNRAHAVARAGHDALTRRDAAGHQATFATDYHIDDRRSGVRLESEGTESTTKAVLSEATGAALTLIATRGDRLALQRSIVRGQTKAGFEWEFEVLMITEINDDGLVRQTVAFDADDLDTALAELDARYLAGEGAPFESVIRSNMAVVATTNRRDWDALRALHSPEVDFVDHRPARFGLLDGHDDFFSDVGAMVDVLPNTRITAIALYPARHGSVALVQSDATTADGGAIEDPLVVLSILDHDTITHVEYFADDDFDAARARLAELAPDRRSAVPSNRAHEVMRASLDALVRHDAAAFNATHAPELRTDDRRSGVRLESEGTESTVKAVLRECTDAEVTLIATRGDLLVLYHQVVRGETTTGFAWELETLALAEINGDGLIFDTVLFDADDVDAARAELDARYRAGEGALVERATAVRSNRADAVVRAGNRAMVQNDAVAFNALHAPGVRIHDRRSGVRLENQDVESTTKEAVRDGTGVDLTLIATRGERLALHRSVFRGQTRKGFEWEIESLVVTEISGGGLIAETVLFNDDDLDAAITELDARYLTGEGAPFASMIRINLGAVDAFNRRDWDALRVLYAPTISMVDHRVAQFPTYTDRDEFFRDVVVMTDVTPDLRMTMAAVYPDHHGTVALMHHTATTADGGEIESMVIGLSIVQDGAVTRLENFAEDALADALARLAELAPD